METTAYVVANATLTDQPETRRDWQSLLGINAPTQQRKAVPRETNLHRRADGGIAGHE